MTEAEILVAIAHIQADASFRIRELLLAHGIVETEAMRFARRDAAQAERDAVQRLFRASKKAAA
jgi:hypothetical protein